MLHENNQDIFRKETTGISLLCKFHLTLEISLEFLEFEVFIAKGWLGKLIAISSKHFEVFRGHLLFQQDIILLAQAYY